MSIFMWIIYAWAILSIFTTVAVLAAAVMAGRSEPVPHPVAAGQSKSSSKNRLSTARQRGNDRRTGRKYAHGSVPLEHAV